MEGVMYSDLNVNTEPYHCENSEMDIQTLPQAKFTFSEAGLNFYFKIVYKCVALINVSEAFELSKISYD